MVESVLLGPIGKNVVHFWVDFFRLRELFALKTSLFSQIYLIVMSIKMEKHILVPKVFYSILDNHIFYARLWPISGLKKN